MTSEDEPSRLLALPFELRVKIWDHVLTNPNPLRPVNEPGRAHEPSTPKENIVDTSLLLTNRQIHKEAAKRLYKKNKLRYTVLQYGLFKLRPNPSHPFRADCLVHVPDMRHISMHCEFGKDHYRLDITMQEYLAVVVDNCTSLRSFTLHLQPVPGEGEYIISRLSSLEANSPKPTFAALLQLPHLERLTILAPHPRCKIQDQDNGLGVAPHIQWVRAPEEGRGDELADVSEGMYARATAALWRYITNPERHQPLEELMTWTLRPREERALKRAREQSQTRKREMQEFMERLGVRSEEREGKGNDEGVRNDRWWCKRSNR